MKGAWPRPLHSGPGDKPARRYGTGEKTEELFIISAVSVPFICIFLGSYRGGSVRFMLRHAAFAPPGATGQRAQGRALCTPGLATSLPAAARYLRSLMCPSRTAHDSLLLSVTSRRVPAARPGHIHSLSGAMSPDHRCKHQIRRHFSYFKRLNTGTTARIAGFGALSAAPNPGRRHAATEATSRTTDGTCSERIRGKTDAFFMSDW